MTCRLTGIRSGRKQDFVACGIGHKGGIDGNFGDDEEETGTMATTLLHLVMSW